MAEMPLSPDAIKLYNSRNKVLNLVFQTSLTVWPVVYYVALPYTLQLHFVASVRRAEASTVNSFVTALISTLGVYCINIILNSLDKE